MTKWGIGLLLSWLKKSLFIWNLTQDILSSWYTVLLKFTLFIILISCRLGSLQRFAQHSMVIRWSAMYLQSTLISSGKNLKARSPISVTVSLLKSVHTAVDAPEAVGIVKRQSFWANLEAEMPSCLECRVKTILQKLSCPICPRWSYFLRHWYMSALGFSM